MPTPMRGEHQQRLRRRQADREAQRGAHERRGAGRGDGHRQHAGEEGVGHRMARLQRRHAARAGTRRTRTAPARFSPISVNSAASAATTAGDCSWKPQPELLAGRAQRQHQRAQRQRTRRPRRRCRPGRAMRWPRRSSAWRVKPTTLIASIGNTQGIRLRIRPPSSAPSSAATKRDRRRGGGAAPAAAGVVAQRRLQRRRHAGARRRDRAASRPRTLASVRQPCAAGGQHHRHHGGAGAALRRQRHAGGPGVALPGLRPLGRRSRSLRRFRGRTPASCRAPPPAGRARCTSSALPSICTLLPGRASGLGCASKAAWKAAPLQRRGAAAPGS